MGAVADAVLAHEGEVIGVIPRTGGATLRTRRFERAVGLKGQGYLGEKKAIESRS